ncbi:hypothetical protein HU830_01835 [Lactobacillus sp. DCY120]|uniref:Uncharacterized protein n=1 Tax=Bombilactobacillus apium TaxID=2675299 RepID=A0A850QZ10_9LACO|nr:hypothetical protein [Bombilactobacillus apium]NVY95933.1 hypothetical protein [Bombilactobacillus apium]
MAVGDWYFDHGAGGTGDWYAQTPDGKVQVQNFNNPGPRSFSIHALGGCVFYKSKTGKTGAQKLYQGSFAENYSIDMNMNKPISKYLLGDNGVVYELKTGNGLSAGTRTGFGEYDDDGTVGSNGPDESFQIPEDTTAQDKLQN